MSERAHDELDPELEEAMDGFFAQAAKDGTAEEIQGLPPSLAFDGVSLARGATLDDYRILREIGRGGMGVVYEALQVSLNRRVALKLMRTEQVDARELSFFHREARACARISHPNIVSVHTAGECEGLPFIAQELVEGDRTLRDFLDEVSRTDVVPADYYERVAHIVEQVAAGLQAAHDEAVIHRDVKPQNVLLAAGDVPMVSDFGLARIVDELSVSRSGEVLGTCGYMSPEQVAAVKVPIDHRTDVFSLGVVLYELLTLRRPFEGDTRDQVVHKIRTQEPVDPRKIRSRVPRDLAAVALKALEKNRSRRYGSMQEFARDLQRYLQREPVSARFPGPARRAKTWAMHHPTITVAVILLVVGLGSTATLYVQARDSSNEARREKANVMRLSALQELEDLRREADFLWPPEPQHLSAYRNWLQRASDVEIGLERGPEAGVLGHLAQLERLMAEGGSGIKARWWRIQLERLVDEIREFVDPDSGLVRGVGPLHGWGIERRRDFAAEIRERSVDGADAQRLWAEAIAAIADPVRAPAYGGLTLVPQLGLLPIGPDPVSGLWEFAHLLSGEAAVRGADDRLMLGEETGIVLVLLPGGSFWMGAQSTDPSAQNYDPLAEEDEAPVHRVTLSPFFLSKFEMTQGQWKRFSGHNPSSYGPDAAWSSDWGTGTSDLLQPVEEISWTTSRLVLWRMGLSLPSEAQWEYAARAGSDAPWSTGVDATALADAANLLDLSYRELEGQRTKATELWDDAHAMHSAIGTYEASAFGLHDMYGNVWEWCLDGHEGRFYRRSPTLDPVRNPEDSREHALRGGSFLYRAPSARSADRNCIHPSRRYHDLGVRPARVIHR